MAVRPGDADASDEHIPARSEPGRLNDDDALRWLSNLTEESALRGTVSRTAFSRSVARRSAVGDLSDLVDDVTARLQLVLWENRTNWTPLTEDRRRAYAYVTAKNMTYQAVDAQFREARKAARAGSDVRLLDHYDPHGLDLGVSDERRRAIFTLNSAIAAVPGVGSAGWAALVRKANKSEPTKAALAKAVEAIEAGQQPDLARLLAAITDWRQWALARLRSGRNLSVAAALADGAFSGETKARRTLLGWWLAQRTNKAPLCPGQLVAAGLFDTLPSRTQQLRAAWSALAGLPEVATTADHDCAQLGVCPPLSTHLGIALERLQTAR